MKTKIILFIFFVFCINFSLANTLSVSPIQLDFEGKVGEEICKNITIKTIGENKIIINDLWAEKGMNEKILSLHQIEGKKLGLEMYYINETKIYEKKIIEICMSGKNSGNYHGALLFRIEDKPIRVGIWMNVNLTGNFLKINGNSVKNTNSSNENWIFITLFFFVILLGLIFVNKRNS